MQSGHSRRYLAVEKSREMEKLLAGGVVELGVAFMGVLLQAAARGRRLRRRSTLLQ
jgi:hypothetical protein